MAYQSAAIRCYRLGWSDFEEKQCVGFQKSQKVLNHSTLLQMEAAGRNMVSTGGDSNTTAVSRTRRGGEVPCRPSCELDHVESAVASSPLAIEESALHVEDDGGEEEESGTAFRAELTILYPVQDKQVWTLFLCSHISKHKSGATLYRLKGQCHEIFDTFYQKIYFTWAP